MRNQISLTRSDCFTTGPTLSPRPSSLKGHIMTATVSVTPLRRLRPIGATRIPSTDVTIQELQRFTKKQHPGW
jgi:hypothetical protein